MNIAILRSSEGDWIGVYLNGGLVAEGHTLHLGEGLDAIGIQYDEQIAPPEAFEEWGYRCPEAFSEVDTTRISLESQGVRWA